MRYYKTLIILLTITNISFSQQEFPNRLEFNTRNIQHEYYSLPYGYVLVKGQYGIFYKHNGLTNAGKVTKPLIICEGYDPFSGNDLIFLYNSLEKTFRDQNNNIVGFLDYLRQDGWDVIILNLQSNGLELERNAELFAKLVREIQDECVANGSNHRPVIGGISMGALISRLALDFMENPATVGLYGAHRAEHYLSFDGPQKGANVPLGYQHMLAQFLDPVFRSNAFFANLPQQFNPLNLINDIFIQNANLTLFQPAPLQMLANYYTSNLKRSDFVNTLNTFNYPSNLHRRIGVANGSWGGNGQNSVSPGGRLFKWDAGTCLFDAEVEVVSGILTVHASYCPIKIEMDVWAMPGDAQLRVYQYFFGTRIGISINEYSGISFTKRSLDRDPANALSDVNLDHTPGGTYRLNVLEDLADDVNRNTIQYRHTWRETFRVAGMDYTITILDFDAAIQTPLGRIELPNNEAIFSFVPTVSALDVSTSNWFYNIRDNLGYFPRRSNTPFDAIYADNVNDAHAFIEDGCMADFMISEISPVNKYIQNRIFPDNYSNTFEARGNIIVGTDVDPQRSPSRYGTGPVTCSTNNTLIFSTGGGRFLDLEDGFDSGEATVDHIENNLTTVNNDLGIACAQTPRNDNRRNLRKEQTSIKTEENPLLDSNKSLLHSGDNKEKASSTPKAYPNPFSENTILEFEVTEDNLEVTLTIYDNKMDKIASIIENKILAKGFYKYDFRPSYLTSGFYFYEFVTPKGRYLGKLILVR